MSASPRRLLLVSALALAAAALTGCGPQAQSDSTSHASKLSPATQAPSAAATPANGTTHQLAHATVSHTDVTASAFPYCSASALHAAAGSSDSAAGHAHLVVVLHNSGTDCVLKGYPKLGLTDASGKRLPVTVTTNGDMAFPAQAPKDVTLGSGKDASFDLGWSRISSTGESSCPSAATLLVAAPGTTHDLAVTTTVDACDHGHLAVSPVVAGSAGLNG